MADTKTTELLKKSAGNKAQQTVEDYLKGFNENVDTVQRLEGASLLNQRFYSLVTDFYLHGWGRMFHFGMRQKGESFKDSLIRHEYYLGDKLQLSEGEKCMDIGCGVAGPMINIAKKYKVEITGINNSSYQISKAREFLKKEGLNKACSIIECDWMDIPLEDQVFDKAYSIEASCHAADNRAKLFAEVYRLLKPGSLFAGYEWVMTELYNPGNPEHQQIKRDIEIGNGISNLNYKEDVIEALKMSGFEVVECRDMALACDAETPWYLPLKGEGISPRMIRKSPVGRFVMRNIFRLLESTGLLPKGALDVSKILNLAGEALVKGGEQKIFTPMLLFVAKKKT